MLILTALSHPANLRTAPAANVAGFLAKDTPAADLIRAIRDVARGARVIDPAVALAALDARPSPLTPRETDVLRLQAEGLDPREIAARLFRSHWTVRNDLASATGKLGARNRIHAIRIATETSGCRSVTSSYDGRPVRSTGEGGPRRRRQDHRRGHR